MTEHRIIPADLKPGDRVVYNGPPMSGIFTKGKEYIVHASEVADDAFQTVNDCGRYFWMPTGHFAKVIPAWPPVEAQADSEAGEPDPLTDRLRSVNTTQAPYANEQVTAWCHEAAAEIELLQQRVRELEAALQPFARAAYSYDAPDENGRWPDIQDVLLTLGNCRRARAALTKGQSDDL